MTSSGRPKGYVVDAPERRQARRRPLRNFAAAPLLLADADLRPLVKDVLDQGSTSSCVENVLAQGARCLAVRDGQSTALASRLALYYQSRAAVQDQGSDDGTLPSAALQAVDVYGLCDEALWPFDPAQVLVPPPDLVYRASFPTRGALRVSALSDDPARRQAEIRDALGRRNPVTIGLSVDAAFEAYTTGTWTPSGPFLGGHYLLGLASRPDALFCLSSWTSSFGEAGGLWVAWNVIEEAATDVYQLEQLLAVPGKG